MCVTIHVVHALLRFGSRIIADFGGIIICTQCVFAVFSACWCVRGGVMHAPCGLVGVPHPTCNSPLIIVNLSFERAAYIRYMFSRSARYSHFWGQNIIDWGCIMFLGRLYVFFLLKFLEG